MNHTRQQLMPILCALCVVLAVNHGMVLYQSNALVPLVLYTPNGALEPKLVTTPVRLNDAAPTILERGRETNLIDTLAANTMDEFRVAWKEQYPKAKLVAGEGLSADERRQLEAVGYMD